MCHLPLLCWGSWLCLAQLCLHLLTQSSWYSILISLRQFLYTENSTFSGLTPYTSQTPHMCRVIWDFNQIRNGGPDIVKWKSAYKTNSCSVCGWSHYYLELCRERRFTSLVGWESEEGHKITVLFLASTSLHKEPLPGLVRNSLPIYFTSDLPNFISLLG